MKFSNEIKIGIIVLGGIILLVWGLNYLKGKNFFAKQHLLYAVYSQVDGLVASNPVQMNGLSIGRVSSVNFLPDNSGNIIVSLTIDNTNIKIPRNTVAKIISADLMGSKAIQLIMGNDTVAARNMDTLKSQIQLSLQEEVNRQVAPIKSKAENLLASMDSVLSVLQYVFNKNTRENLSKSFESIEKTVKALERTSVRFDTIVYSQQGRIVSIFNSVESVAQNIKGNNEKIANIIQNFSSISDSIAKADLVTTITQANSVLKDFAKVMERINKGEGSLGLLLNNDSLYNNLSATSDNLNKLIQDINQNPRKYVRFSVIGGKN